MPPSFLIGKNEDCESNPHFMRFYKANQPMMSLVSRAITSSSLVGITKTLTLESGVEIIISSPRLEFASLSIFTPRYQKYSDIAAREALLFSPTPAVKMMASTPFIAAT